MLHTCIQTDLVLSCIIATYSIQLRQGLPSFLLRLASIVFLGLSRCVSISLVPLKPMEKIFSRTQAIHRVINLIVIGVT